MGKHAGSGRGVEKSALPRVRVSDETNPARLLTPFDFALLASVNLREFAFEIDDAFLRDSAVDFELLFAWSAKPDATFSIEPALKKKGFRLAADDAGLRLFYTGGTAIFFK